MKPAPALLAVTFLLAGCRNPARFHASGALDSSGGGLEQWRRTPDGCSRSPFDGLPLGQTRSVITLLWDDAAHHDPKAINHRWAVPDAPLRLEIERLGPASAGQVFTAQLTTAKGNGAVLDPVACDTFTLTTHEGPRLIPEGRSTLAGHLVLDCRAQHGNITADITFQGCEY